MKPTSLLLLIVPIASTTTTGIVEIVIILDGTTINIALQRITTED
jgi:hypothetical protein